MAKDDIDTSTKAYRNSAAFKRASFHPPDEIWTMFVDAEGFTDVVYTFKALVAVLNIDKDQDGQDLHGIKFYEALRSKLTSWKCQSLWDLLNARLKCSEYRHENEYVAKGLKCMIIGAGPIGLRTAIEMLMLGCRAVVVEKRKDFARNNVLHLWPFLMTDFRQLGAKKFYGKFGAGSIDHINIKTLQTLLLKVALVLGVEVYCGVEFQEIVEPTEQHGWRVQVHPDDENISKHDFNVIIGADGKKNVLPGFTQIEMRGQLAIGITCNFMNNNTPEEKGCKEISGISYQFKPAFFDALKEKHGVMLENIVYYKDETHYFVMTARKSSLLEQGVFLQDYVDPSSLVRSSNINKKKLVEYTCNAVYYSTTLPKVEFKKLSNGEPDVALFDFTSLKKAENSSRIIERKKHKLVMSLVGDSLIEPFWPTGSGCGRGVLSSLDIAWMVRQFALNYPPLAILRERENVFKLHSCATHDNLQKNMSSYTIDPKTRYSALDTKTVLNIAQLKSLYDTDDVESADMTMSSPAAKPKYANKKKTTIDRRKSGGSTASRPSGRATAGKTKRKLERQESREKTNRNEDAKQKLSIGDKKKFFEEHNKKLCEGGGASKPKRASLHSEQFTDLQGIDEEIHDSDDDVLIDEDEEPAPKKKVTSHKGGSLKRQSSKENILMKRQSSKENVSKRKGSLKRQASRESLKRQSSREGKSLRRQSSTDGGESSGSMNDEVSGKPKKYQAKGGGLKSKKSSEKSDSNKAKRRSSGDKKTTAARRRSRRSVSNEGDLISEVEDSREQSASFEQVDAKSFFLKWMEKLLPKLFTETSSTPPETLQHPKEVCAQVSVVPVMALALLYNCNKPVRRTTTELRLKELIANANNRQPNASHEKHETTEELSFIKTGRVKDSMAKFQQLVQKEEQSHSFYDFIRKTKESSAAGDDENGILLVKHGSDDFTPKDVIDIEEQLLADEEEERKRSPFGKMTTGGVPSNTEVEVRLLLERLCDQQSPFNAILMLQVLYNIHKRILDEPNEDRHYRVYTKGETFNKYVWRWEGAKTYFLDTGWIQCGDFLVLSKSRPIDLVVKVIQDVFRRNRRLQLTHSGSVNAEIEILVPEVAQLQHSTINNEDLFNEDVASTYTKIDIPTDKDVSVPTEGDSAIGSGIDDDDDVDGKDIDENKPTLQRLQSIEHNMGDEAYIVVDFVDELEEEQSSLDIIEEHLENNYTIDAVQITPDEEVELAEYHTENSSPWTTLNRSYDKEEGETTKGNEEAKNDDDDTMTIKTWTVVSKPESGTDITIELTSEKTSNTAKNGKKKFKASNGLKREKKVDEFSPMKDDTLKTNETIETYTPKTNGTIDTCAVSEVLESPAPICTSSVNSNNESLNNSIVKQNTQLFDQQIANNLKARYTTPKEVLLPRLGSVGKAGVTAFEKNLFEKESVKEKKVTSPNGSDELDLSGKVAGAKSLFENGSVSGTVKSNKEPKYSREESSKIDNVKPAEGSKVEKVDEPMVTNSVPETKTGNKKKKKNPFKKKKDKSKKLEENTKTDNNVEPDVPSVPESSQTYEERDVDVAMITSLIDSYAGVKPEGETTNENIVNNDVPHTDRTLSNDVKVQQLPSTRSLNLHTDISLTNDNEEDEIRRTKSVADKPARNEDAEVRRTSSFVVNRNSKKRPRLAKTRGSESLVSADEELLTETLISDVATSDFSFDKLAELEADEEIVPYNHTSKDVVEVHVDQSIFTHDRIKTTPKDKDVMEVNVDRSIFTKNMKPIEVDINSLDNESCIDDDLNECHHHISASSPPVIRVTESDPLSTSDTGELNDTNDDELTNILDEMHVPMDEMHVPSETPASFYDTSSMELSAELQNSTGGGNSENDSKKKKKKFPFRISLGKKEKHKKPKVSLREDVFENDTNVESNPNTPKLKKKSKSKDTLERAKKTSASSGEGLPNLSSSNSISSPPSSTKSKKMQFFKKKKSGSSTPTLEIRSSYSHNENELHVNGKVNGTSGSTPPSPELSNHQNTNGHTNYDKNDEVFGDRLI